MSDSFSLGTPSLNAKLAILRNPLVVTPDTTVREATILMSGASLCELVPREPTSSEPPEARSRPASCVLVAIATQVIGIFTEQDVIRLSAEQQAFDRLTMTMVMSQNPITRRESELTDIFTVLQLLEAYQIRHLPILDEAAQLVGLITASSLRQICRPMDLLRLRLVEEVMLREVICAAPEDSILAIAQQMSRHRISSVVITQTDIPSDPTQHRPVGVITERDVVQFQALGLDLVRYQAAVVMSAPLVTISPQDSLWTVQVLMAQRHIRRLVVVGEQGELQGIVTQTSVLHALNPIEMYQLTAALQAKVTQLETEKVALIKRYSQAQETRWQFALEAAGDGIWDWDFQTNELWFSSQWKTTLGYDAAANIGHTLNEFIERVHPDDIARNAVEIDKHLRGETPLCQVEYRIRCQDGSYKWILDRGKVLARNPDGQPLRMMGVFTDISDRKQLESEKQQAEALICAIATETGSTTHDEFFHTLAVQLAQLLKITCVAIVELIPEGLRTLALWHQHQMLPQLIYPLAETPCEQVVENGVFVCERGLQQQFPTDQFLVEMGLESYVGMVFKDDQGLTLGHICILDTQPLSPSYIELAQTVLKVFAARVTAELLRKRAEAALQELNATLEAQVHQRTEALQAAQTELQQTTQQLQALLNHAPQLISLFDRDGRYLSVNPSLAQVLGGAAAEVIGRTFTDVLPAPIAARFLTRIDEMAVTRQPLEVEDEIWDQQTRSYRVYQSITFPVFEVEGQPQQFAAIAQDITARKQTETALQNREILFRSLFEQSSLGIAFARFDSLPPQPILVNSRLCELLGYAEAELLSMRYADITHPDDLPLIQAEIEQLTNGTQQSYHLENRYIRQDGSIFWAKTNVSVITDVPNYGCLKVIFIEDISEQKQAEIALQHSESRYRAFFDQAAVGINQADPSGQFMSVNQAFCTMLGYTEAELLQLTYQEITHPEDLERHRETYAQLLAGIIPFSLHEKRYRCKNGEYVWTQVAISVLRDLDGSIISDLAVIVDISERKAVAAQVEAIAQRLTLATTAARMGIWDLDLRNNQLLWDEQMYALYGITADAFSDHYEAWRQRVHPDDLATAEAAVQNTIAGKADLHTTFRAVWPNGEIHHIEAHAISLRDEAGRVHRLIGANWDVSDRQQTEQDLIQARDAAEAAARAKSDFLACISHEIRTPMNGVIGMLSVLAYTPLSQEQHSYVEIAQSSADALLVLLNDILDFSKVDAGMLSLEAMDFDLGQQVGEFAKTMALEAQKKGLELILDLSEVSEPQVNGDSHRLLQIFANLVGNAIKFTQQGEIEIRVRTAAIASGSAQSATTAVCVTASVRDTGIGIAADKFTHLFEVFTQADASSTRAYGGMGLGLAIVQRLCALMGGRVRVDSELGRGSCFEFTVQLQPARDRDAVDPPLALDTLNLRVLVVDDNTTHRRVLSRQLAQWGVQTILEASNGETALALLAQQAQQTPGLPPVDLLLVDLQMPGMDGLSFAQRLQTYPDFTDLPLVMMIPFRDRGNIPATTAWGLPGYINKPVVSSDLQGILSQLQESRELRPSLSLLRRAPETTGTTYIRLLMVEDNRVNQIVFQSMIANLGLEIEVATNGKVAIDKLSQAPVHQPYTLIFMDCLMPIMDGYEATRQIRAGQAGDRYRTIPIIAMTASAMEGDRERCLAAGMNDYLTKPIQMQTLIQALESMKDAGRG